MGRMYSVSFSAVSQTAATTAPDDIFQIQGDANKTYSVHSITYTQSNRLGDSQADMGSIALYRTTTAGSGGTSLNAQPLDPSDVADSSTCLRHNSTEAAGTLTLMHAEGFNWQSGWFYRPTPEERITLGGGAVADRTLVVVLGDTVAADTDTSFTMVFEEIG